MAGTKNAAKAGTGFTAEERAAMKERAAELRAERQGASRAESEAAVVARIAAMPEPDRVIAERFHAIVHEHAPELASRLWYGMPAYTRDGKVVCFFKDALKFKSRYATIGFEDAALLDDGNVWATSYAVTALTADDEARIAALVARAATGQAT